MENNNLDPSKKDKATDFEDADVNNTNTFETVENHVNTANNTSTMDTTNVQLNAHEIKSPVVLFIGPGSSGKTVSLVRLARFLNRESKGFDVAVNKQFVHDKSPTQIYNKNIEDFNDLLHDTTNKLPDPTAKDGYILLDIRENEKLFCQILEAPGENYFNPTTQKQYMPPYLATILANEYPIVFTFLFERNMLKDQNNRTKYDQRMVELLDYFDPKRGDQFLLLYNKIDENADWKTSGGDYDEDQVKKDLVVRFPLLVQAIDHICRNSKKQRFFSIFSSGTFTDNQWIQSPKKYSERLWETVYEAIAPKFPWIYVLIAFLIIVIVIVSIVLATS